MSSRWRKVALGPGLVVVLAAAAVAAEAAGQEAVQGKAAGALERFKALAGEWKGTNSKGETVSISYEIVAAGSAVLERFVHSAEDPSPMLTVYHLDKDDLMLTHYCMVGNQPRMRAKTLSGDEVAFDFLDATALASPETGHMHRALFRFQGRDRFTTEWTWRENGRDAFTEVVVANRMASAAAAGSVR